MSIFNKFKPVISDGQTKVSDDASQVPFHQDVPGLDVSVCDHWLASRSTDFGVKMGDSCGCRVSHQQLEQKSIRN